MKSINYLKRKMEQTRELFPFLRFSYVFVDNIHYVDVDFDALDGNDPFFTFTEIYMKEFYTLFPDEELFFISEEIEREIYFKNITPIFKN